MVANLGTTCAEFAGIAAASELAGVDRLVSVPLVAVALSLLVVRGGFRRIEHVLLALATVFAAYIVAGVLAGPDWGAAAEGLAVPRLPAGSAALVAVTATVGTTLAPWGLAFIQSYAVDKRLSISQLRLERVDVVTGAVMTGVIGFFIVIACAATLHADGRSIETAGDAAVALEPLAGRFASLLFGAGLLGAALLAASILPSPPRTQPGGAGVAGAGGGVRAGAGRERGRLARTPIARRRSPDGTHRLGRLASPPRSRRSSEWRRSTPRPGHCS